MVAQRLLLSLAFLAQVGVGPQAASPSLVNAGLQIDAASMGTFTPSYPQLIGQDGAQAHALIEKTT
jgi:hypothetical protein